MVTLTADETEFAIVDLRQVSSAQLAPLLEEEQAAWREQLRWDYRPSLALIKRHVDAHSLPGYVALARSSRRVAGYVFFVCEDHKGLLGDLYVGQEFLPRSVAAAVRAGLATQLLEHTLTALEATPGVTRIEAQPILFGTEPLAPVFLAHNFSSYPRLFMYKALEKTSEAKAPYTCGPYVPHTNTEWEIQAWSDGFFAAMAELMVSAYREHVDSRINDQYCTSSGTLKFLKNIVVFPGCGVFQPEASFVALAEPSGVERENRPLAGAILVSQVAARVAHITQICVRRELQGAGLGTRLLVRTLDHLRQRGYEGVSLSVTAENQPAVRLYHRFGFQLLKNFTAYVWQKP